MVIKVFRKYISKIIQCTKFKSPPNFSNISVINIIQIPLKRTVDVLSKHKMIFQVAMKL